MDELTWGEPIDAPDPEGVQGAYLSALAHACIDHPSFAFVGWRRVSLGEGRIADYLVVDARDGGWAPRPDGFQRVERLALGYLPHWPIPLDVRALRPDFPDALHRNGVAAEEPKSLCLYGQPWRHVKRAWTAYGHLERILWWLRGTADGTVHAPDQPLEPVFFGTPVSVILPCNAQAPSSHLTRRLSLAVISRPDAAQMIVRGQYDDGAKANEECKGNLDILEVRLPPVDADVIRRFPPHLAALHDDFAAMGSDLLSPLRCAIAARAGAAGLAKRFGARPATLIVLHIPRLRDGKEDSTEIRGFLLAGDLASVGEACGVLANVRDDGRLYPFVSLEPDSETEAATGRAKSAALTVMPVNVSFELDERSARLHSGIEEDVGVFRGVLVGVGALGSLLAELWARSGWGRWDYVDGDILLPHNVVRHLGKSAWLGLSKADIVQRVSGFVDANDPSRGRAFVEMFDRPTGELAAAMGEAGLLVDATTTLHVGRDAMENDTMPRMASVFLTPNGQSSVMLLDSADRSVRVAHLEAQYYRAILRSDWGAHHLDGHAGTGIDAGAGCRRAAATLPYDLVHIHAGTLSHQLRRCADEPDARLLVWSLDQTSGALRAETTTASAVLMAAAGEWRVVWDQGVEQQMRAQRAAHLPRETGGILLGYLDQVLKVAFVVDALPAPQDSKADTTGFTRGKTGVRESIQEAQRRTTGIVDYIGEWHSHPKGHSAAPSDLDVVLLAQLAALRAREQLPTLMLIAGEGRVSVSFAHSLDTSP